MLLSVVVPVFNEADGLAHFHARLKASLEKIPSPYEIIYVDDGSRDASRTVLADLRDGDATVGLINLSRNFGKEAAMTAGLDHARGDAVVVIDADLQDPPELIGELYRVWQEEKVDVVYAKRTSRAGETWLKKTTSHAFYRLMGELSNVDIPYDTGDFRLMSRRVVAALQELRERHRFMKGLFAWVGFPSKAVLYERDPRYAGASKWDYLKLWNFSLEGITGFSIVPLKIASYVGLVISVCSGLYAAWIVIRTALYGADLPGYPSVFTAVVFLGGVQLLFLGIIGEYLGRVFNETKHRPIYIIEDCSLVAPKTPDEGAASVGEINLKNNPALQEK
jgi:polyisoprenyl-phosphate glycosyltransferase